MKGAIGKGNRALKGVVITRGLIAVIRFVRDEDSLLGVFPCLNSVKVGHILYLTELLTYRGGQRVV